MSKKPSQPSRKLLTRCEECKHKFRVPSEYWQQEIKCPNCNNQFIFTQEYVPPSLPKLEDVLKRPPPKIPQMVEVTLKHPIETGIWFGIGLILAPLVLIIIVIVFWAIIMAIAV